MDLNTHESGDYYSVVAGTKGGGEFLADEVVDYLVDVGVVRNVFGVHTEEAEFVVFADLGGDIEVRFGGDVVEFAVDLERKSGTADHLEFEVASAFAAGEVCSIVLDFREFVAICAGHLRKVRARVSDFYADAVDPDHRRFLDGLGVVSPDDVVDGHLRGCEVDGIFGLVMVVGVDDPRDASHC